MDFTVFTYNVESGATYWSIARDLMRQSEEYEELTANDTFVQKVVDGLLLYRNNRKLYADTKINLVREIEFYLNIKEVYPVGAFRRGEIQSTLNDNINYVNAVNNDLLFAIKYFNTYESFAWNEFRNNGKEKYGELNIYDSEYNGARGDRTDTTALKNGYIYVFDEKDTLINSFRVMNGKYQEVLVSSTDDSHTKIIGPKREYALIRNFFNQTYGYADGQTIVVSKIKLTTLRLFGTDEPKMKIDPRKCGIQFYKTKADYKKGAEEETRSGPQIFNDWKSLNASYSIDFYRFLNADFSGEHGFYLLFPEPFEELKRRANLFQKRFKKYETWTNDEEHIQISYLYSAVQSMIRQDPGMKGYINQEAFREQGEKNSEEYRENNWPVLFYAVRDLVNWLKSNMLMECARNYLCGTDEEQIESAEVYKQATDKLQFTKEGADYLQTAFDDKYSYISMALALKPEYFNDNPVISSTVAIRKWNNVVFGLFDNVAIIFSSKTKNAIADIIDLVAEKTGKIMNIKNVRPLNRVNLNIDVVDVDSFIKASGSTFSSSKIGKSIISLVELINVGIAIKGLLESNKENFLDSCINLVGASIDLLAGNWLFENCLNNRIGPMFVKGATTTFTKSFLLGMNLISGVIDCYLGIKGAMQAFNDGEIMLCIGWGAFALGGALIAVGAACQLAAIKVTGASAGTLIKFGAIGFVAGCILEGIGLLLVANFDNRDIKDWLDKCEFGRSAEPKKPLKEQIQLLNDILCDFRVKAEFRDIEMKFNNETYVKIIIEPRILTETSRIEFSNVKAIAESRLGEILENEKHKVMGGAGSEQPKINLWEPPKSCKIYKNSNGFIEKVEVSFNYGMDIDRVKGKIKIDVNNGTLQGLTKEFEVTAGI